MQHPGSVSHSSSRQRLAAAGSVLLSGLTSLLIGLISSNVAAGNTGTFIDRHNALDLRVVSYNVLWDRIFPDLYPTQAAKFERVVSALDPDILHLQEINRSASDVADLLDEIAPVTDGNWHTYQGRDNVIASKYPLTMTASNTIPSGQRGQAIALVDLPDEEFGSDFYFMNNHYACCNGVAGDPPRQRQSDAIANWLRDAKTPGGFVDIPPGTPFAVVGDLNIVGGSQPLDTLIDGNIIDEETYGLDSLPDWDGSHLTDAHPVHNGSLSEDYTWRDDNLIFDPGRLDYIIYSDSALDMGNQFVLNTVQMSSQELTATGLQTFDVTVDSAGVTYDHLPVVVDFRLFDFSTTDFNFDRIVDDADRATWQIGFGNSTAAHRTDGDANDDGDIDGGDFLLWQQQFSDGVNASSVAVPEPTPICLCLLSLLSLVAIRS